MTGIRDLDDDLSDGVDVVDIDNEVAEAERELDESEALLQDPADSDELPADTVPATSEPKKGSPKMLLILGAVGLSALVGFGFVVKTILFPAAPTEVMVAETADLMPVDSTPMTGAAEVVDVAPVAVPVDPVAAAMANLNQPVEAAQAESARDDVSALRPQTDETVPSVDVLAQSSTVTPSTESAQFVQAHADLNDETDEPMTIDLRPYDEALGTLNAQVSSLNDRLDAGEKQNRKMHDDMTAIRKLLEAQVAEQRRIADALTAQKGFSADPLVKRRSRLKGYAVVSVTSDGQMVIVRDPKNNNVVIERDGVLKEDGVSLKIEDLAYNGKLVLLGTRYFIDHVFEEKVMEKSVPAAKPVQEKPVVIEQQAKHQDAQQPLAVQTLPAQIKPTAIEPGLYIQGDATRQREGRNTLEGWTLHGVVADGFLIRDPNGAFKTVRINETIPGVGVVKGPNGNGDLQVGSFLIRAEN